MNEELIDELDICEVESYPQPPSLKVMPPRVVTEASTLTRNSANVTPAALV